MPRESCLYKDPTGRYMESRLERLVLCGYDRCAASLMGTFAYWTDRELNTPGELVWIERSKKELREDLLGFFGEWSIERGIAVLESLGVLQVELPKETCGKTLYQFDYPKANRLLMAIQEKPIIPPRRCPNNRNGWEARQGKSEENLGDSSLGENAEGLRRKRRSCLGENAEGPSAKTPKPYKEEGYSNKATEQGSLNSPYNPPSEEPERILAEGPEEAEGSTPYSARPRRPVGGYRRKPKDPDRWKMRSLPGQNMATASAGDGGDEPLAPRTAGTSSQPPAASPNASWVAERWNELVPSCPMKADPIMDIRACQKIVSNVGLVEKFDEVCRKAEEVLAADPVGNGWVTMLWLLQEKNGTPNWSALLRSGLDWAKNKNGGRKPAEPEWMQKYLKPTETPK